MQSHVRSALKVAAIFVLAACSMKPRVDPVAEEATLRARSDSLQAAEAAMDQARSLSFWAPDGIIQPAGSPQIEGHDAIAATYKAYFETMNLKSLIGKTSKLTISAAGDLAYETGVNHMTFGTPKGDMLDVGKFLLVWKKTNGTWYVEALSFTSDAAAPVPAPAK